MLGLALCIVGLLPSQPQDGPQCTVLVTDSERRPVPGAQVYWASGITRPLSAIVAGGVDEYDRHREQGTRFETGEDGKVRVPCSPEEKQRATILVESRSLWAGASLPTTAGVVRVQLAPNHVIELVLHDDEGASVAELPVLLTLGTKGETLRRGLTDGRGHVRFERLPANEVEPDETLFAVRFDVLGGRRSGPTVRLGQARGGPVRLAAPPLGRVEIEVDGLEAAPATQLMVGLGPANAYEEGEIATVHERVARFAVVADGSSLVARIAGTKDVVHFEAPTARGETVVERLSWKPDVPILVGRAVDENGRPLMGTRVQIGVDGRWASPRLDVQGRFTVRLQWRPIDSKDVTDQALVWCTREGQPPRRGQFAVPRTDAPGIIDIGEVVVERLPVLLSGTLQGPGEWSSDSVALRVERQVEQLWRSVTTVGDRIEPDGRFVAYIEELDPTVPWRVSAHDGVGGFSTRKAMEFRPGDADVQVELLRLLSPTIRVQFPPGVSAQFFSIRLEGEGLRRWELRPRRGKVRLDSVFPGKYRITVESRGWDSSRPLLRFAGKGPLLVLEDLEVRASGKVDERLRKLDLSDIVHTVRLDVSTVSGDSVPGLSVTAGTGDRPAAGFDLEAATIATDVPCDFFLRAPGFRSVLLERPRGKQTVVMQLGAAVRITVPEDLPLPPEGVAVRMQLTEQVELPRYSVRSPGVARATLGAGRALEVRVPSRGEYHAHWWLDKGEQSVHLTRESPSPTIVVDGGAGPASFEIGWKPEWLEAALSELK
ncbi:MAG: hypothetical protein GY711_27260 [bacterium]|nr:hypothetical protein [bacterium]